MGLQDLQLNNVKIATPSELDRIRFPEIISTDSYLEDPISYRPDERFRINTAVQQTSEIFNNQVQRDFADFLQVDFNENTPQILTVNMFSQLTSRTLYNKVIGPRAQFEQFGVDK